MLQTKSCTFTSEYSEIKGFQKHKTVTYSAEIVPKGILLSVKQVSGSEIYTESCICSSESFDKAKAFMKYISENSIGIGCWYDILHDMEMQYTVV
ncbi:MAG: hypothetical protein ACI4QZ_03000 [Eubacteriales bacterium]